MAAFGKFKWGLTSDSHVGLGHIACAKNCLPQWNFPWTQLYETYHIKYALGIKITNLKGSLLKIIDYSW